MEAALSRREREVADLVAEGLTNREIAERLVISERTAEGHVEQIRNKLGFRSRSQIAAWVPAERQRAAAPATSSGTAVAVALALPRAQLRLPRAPRLSRRMTAAALALLLVGVAATAVWPRTPPVTLVLVAGAGTDGFSGDGGPAAMAQFSELTSLAFDRTGGLLVADSVTGGQVGIQDMRTRIRRIDGSGIVRTIVGEAPVLRDPNVAYLGITLRVNREARIAVGPQGDLYIAAGYAESAGHWIGRIDPDDHFTWIVGGRNAAPTEVRRSNLLYPRGMAIGADDTIYVADSGNNRVLAVPRDGEVKTIAGTGARGAGGDGGPAASAMLFAPLAVRLSADGAVYIADTNNDRIRAVDHGGTISTIVGDGTQGYAGDGGPAARGRLSHPSDIAFGPRGVLYIADTGNARVRAVAPDGTITTVVGPDVLVRPTAVAVDASGTLFIADAGAHRIYKAVR